MVSTSAIVEAPARATTRWLAAHPLGRQVVEESGDVAQIPSFGIGRPTVAKSRSSGRACWVTCKARAAALPGSRAQAGRHHVCEHMTRAPWLPPKYQQAGTGHPSTGGFWYASLRAATDGWAHRDCRSGAGEVRSAQFLTSGKSRRNHRQRPPRQPSYSRGRVRRSARAGSPECPVNLAANTGGTLG